MLVFSKEYLSAILENSAQLIEEIQKASQETREEINKILKDLTETISHYLPRVEMSFNNLLKAYIELGNEFIRIGMSMFDIIFDEIAAHSDEINAFLNSVSDICQGK